MGVFEGSHVSTLRGVAGVAAPVHALLLCMFNYKWRACDACIHMYVALSLAQVHLSFTPRLHLQHNSSRISAEWPPDTLALLFVERAGAAVPEPEQCVLLALGAVITCTLHA